MAKQPKISSKMDESALRKGLEIAKASGNKSAVRKIEGIMRQRRNRDSKRALDFKKAQSDPYTRYNPNGPN